MTSGSAVAAINIPFTINLSENVTVTGTPRIAVDVGGNTRYATYTSGTGTNSLTFTLSPNIGDVDMDGVTLSSPIDLNGGTIKDTAGNDATLTFTPPNTTGIKINYPSLGMDFTNGTTGRYTLNGTVYNDLSSFLTASGGTFSRNSIATYFDSTGTLQTASANTPRFYYDPVTHVAKGILIEESRTNIATYSEQMENAAWGHYLNSVAANVIAAPDGAMTADKIVIDSGTHSGGSRLHRILTLADNSNYTFSFYIKAAEFTSAGIFGQNKTGGNGYFNVSLTSPTSPQSNSMFSYMRSTDMGNGWLHFVLVFNSGAGATSPLIAIYAQCFCGTTGDGVKGFYLWGAQLEQGSSATSYIPTTTATVTRGSDIFSIPTGAWYDTSKGTMLSRYEIPYLTGTNYPGTAVISNGTGANGNILYVNAAAKYKAAQIKSGNIISFNQGAGSGSALAESTPSNDALAYEANNANFSTNGTIGAIDTAVTVPTSVSTLYIGGDGLGITSKLNGRISTFKYYPSRTNDTQLQLLTQ